MEYQSEIEELKREIKIHRVERNQEKAKEKISLLNKIDLRISTFSHIADGIAWQLFKGKLHIARRFYLGETSKKKLVFSNIAHAKTVADEINRSPEDFALISDITNYVQIGDLIAFQNGKLNIFELKEGKVNKKIYDFLNKMEKDGKEIFPNNLPENFDENTIKQTLRVIRQKERMLRLKDLLKNDKGIDPVSGENMEIVSPQTPTHDFVEELEQLYCQMNCDCKTWAYNIIEDCVHIGIYRGESIQMSQFLIPEILKSS